MPAFGRARRPSFRGTVMTSSGSATGRPRRETTRILAFAVEENRVVVKLDKDFGELAVVFGHAHSGIVRIVNFQISKHASVCLSAIEQHGEELAKRAIITAEPGRLRVRPAQTDLAPDR
jgi:predicted nuclease of predicted toxin-antitoxin system